MTPLDCLIRDPSATANDILAASDDFREIFDAAGRVLADVERLADAAAKAEVESETMTARIQAADINQFNAMVEEAYAAQLRAIQAMQLLQLGWERYQPWREALDLIEAAVAISQRNSFPDWRRRWQTAN